MKRVLRQLTTCVKPDKPVWWRDSERGETNGRYKSGRTIEKKFRTKFVEGRDGLGRRTGAEGGCRVRPGAQGRELAAGPSIPLRPQALVIIIHLQCLILGKELP
ncbi:hypothetical protein E2C01_068361 [Portunus trituberculatus]|uniref:Uncharacterized protein n=1 Tax=Portunus trituberculatus TaxID=210409 RepID=A0A5B7HWA1_PORTR|nr:hypothetical protein [Portunus trituberculatus]